MSEIIDLFLCHNGADKEWTRGLAEQIESETFDGSSDGRTLRVFFDEWDIDPGRNVVQAINDGLSRARFVGVVLSPEMLEAPWPAMEWTHQVAADPTNASGRLIPLFLRDGSDANGTRVALPAPFLALAWLDFRDPKEFKRSFQKLVRRIRGLPLPRGRKRSAIASVQRPTATLPSDQGSAAPDPVSEALLGNLLPVESYPGTIWSAPTTLRKNKEVFEKIGDCPAFNLQAERLYTFADLSGPKTPFRKVVDQSDVRSDLVSSWREDADKWRWFITLLNRSLRNHLGTLPIRRDKRGRFFFLPKDGETRTWKNRDDRSREVAAKKTNPSTNDTFWVHQAAWLQFQTLGDALYILVDPMYVFTADGRNPLRGKGVGPLSMQWTGKERNASILRHIVFWARTLSRGASKIEIRTGGSPIVASAIPALARIQAGIEFDHVALGSLIEQVQDELGQAAASVQLVSDEGGEQDGEEEAKEGSE